MSRRIPQHSQVPQHGHAPQLSHVPQRSGLRRRVATAVAVAALALTPAAANAQSSFPTSSGGCPAADAETCVESPVEVAGTERDAVWYLPDGPASALMLLEHGFGRSCANLDGTARAIAAQGLMVICLDEDMTAGNPELAGEFADALARRTLVPPNGLPLPQRYVVGGHSAGGHFAALVGAGLVERSYPDLAGAVLFDPVAAEGFSAALRSVSGAGSRPVLSIAASPSVVNLFDNSFGALASLGADFVGIQLLRGSCHIDVEGEDTDLVGIAGATCVPDPATTARLRDFGGVWARDPRDRDQDGDTSVHSRGGAAGLRHGSRRAARLGAAGRRGDPGALSGTALSRVRPRRGGPPRTHIR